MLPTILLTFVLFYVCQAQTSNPNILCELCNNGFSLVQTQLITLESFTKTDLEPIIQTVCLAAPTDIPIVKAVCTVLKENVVDALVTLVQGLREQMAPDLLCGYINICKSENNKV